MMAKNEFGQPVGEQIPEWVPAPLPSAQTLKGRYCTLERLNPDKHAEQLYAAYSNESDGRDWTYLPVGPWENFETYFAWTQQAAASVDPRHYAVVDNSNGQALGTLALMRHDPANGVIEVGFVVFSGALKRTRIATEAHYLLMSYVFDTLGYRRYEWKCDSRNEPSMKAARRLGFDYEGTFRQHVFYKGRNRDTAWFSIIDGDWPRGRAAFNDWLDPSNFDNRGQQRRPLSINR